MDKNTSFTVYELRLFRFLLLLLSISVLSIGFLFPIVTDGTRAISINLWSSTSTYKTGSIVSYNGTTWKAKTDINQNEPPVGVGNGFFSDRQLLLNRRIGFGRNATGGFAGPTYHVTNSSSSGVGSLADAVSGNSPRWIVFDKDLTINLANLPSNNGMTVGSNKTIDGRGHNITITGHNHYGLLLKNASNVIIENITLRDFGDTNKTSSNDMPDAINIETSKNVWLDHLDLSHTGDKLVSVNSGSENVTVSWSHLHDQAQTFQIGSQSTDSPANVGTIPTQTVTLHHNWFDHTGYRNPVSAFAKVHTFNNWIQGWKTYGIRSERTSDTVSDFDMFSAESDKNATLVKPADDGCNDKKTKCDGRYGYLRARNALSENGAKIVTNTSPASTCKSGSQCEQSTPALTAPKLFEPKDNYSYSPDATNSLLKNRISSYSGPNDNWEVVASLPATAPSSTRQTGNDSHIAGSEKSSQQPVSKSKPQSLTQKKSDQPRVLSDAGKDSMSNDSDQQHDTPGKQYNVFKSTELPIFTVLRILAIAGIAIVIILSLVTGVLAFRYSRLPPEMRTEPFGPYILHSLYHKKR